MFRFSKKMLLAYTAICFLVLLNGCHMKESQSSSQPKNSVFSASEVRVFRYSEKPSVQLEGNSEDAKEITGLVEKLLETNTKEPGFVSLAVSEETIKSYQQSDVCVELILDRENEYAIYGADDSRSVSLKKCLIAINQKMLFYSEGADYLSGPLVLSDTTDLSNKIKELS